MSESVVCASPEKREDRDCLYDLGVEVSPRRTNANVADMLRDGLGSISLAPLKPQQRLYIATHHLLPKCHHQLALSPSSAKYLRWLDRTVRPALRSESPDPVIAAMLKTVSVSARLALRMRQTSLNGRVMTSSRDRQTTLTVDGRGLERSSQVPECHRWVNPVSSGGVPNGAHLYISAIKV